MNQRLLKLKMVGNVLTILGVIIVVISTFIPSGVEYDAMWRTVLQWGAGVAFSGIVIRIARFLYLW